MKPKSLYSRLLVFCTLNIFGGVNEPTKLLAVSYRPTGENPPTYIRLTEGEMPVYDTTKLERFLFRNGCRNCSVELVLKVVNGALVRMTEHAFFNSKKTKVPRKLGLILQDGGKTGCLRATRKCMSLVRVVQA